MQTLAASRTLVIVLTTILANTYPAAGQGCAPNTYSCATLGLGPAFSNACCENGQVCHADAAGSAACCPVGAVCTGTLAPGSYAPAPTAVSYVPNTYGFPFPYAPTSFADGNACRTAVSRCSDEFTACTTRLAAGVGPAGGVTVVVSGQTTITNGAGATPTTGLGASGAASACSSLSSAACGRLRNDVCTIAGGATTDGYYIGTGGGNWAPRATPAPGCLGVVVGAAVVAGWGVADML